MIVGLPMDEDVNALDQRFRPLRPEPRRRLIAAIVFGPLLWLAALDVAAALVEHIDLIELGVLAVVASLLLATIVLSLLRLLRRREERLYAHRA